VVFRVIVFAAEIFVGDIAVIDAVLDVCIAPAVVLVIVAAADVVVVVNLALQLLCYWHICAFLVGDVEVSVVALEVVGFVAVGVAGIFTAPAVADVHGRYIGLHCGVVVVNVNDVAVFELASALVLL